MLKELSPAEYQAWLDTQKKMAQGGSKEAEGRVNTANILKQAELISETARKRELTS